MEVLASQFFYLHIAEDDTLRWVMVTGEKGSPRISAELVEAFAGESKSTALKMTTFKILWTAGKNKAF